MNRNEIKAFCKGFKQGRKAANTGEEIDIIARLLWVGIITDDEAEQLRKEREEENLKLINSKKTTDENF